MNNQTGGDETFTSMSCSSAETPTTTGRRFYSHSSSSMDLENKKEREKSSNKRIVVTMASDSSKNKDYSPNLKRPRKDSMQGKRNKYIKKKNTLSNKIRSCLKSTHQLGNQKSSVKLFEKVDSQSTSEAASDSNSESNSESQCIELESDSSDNITNRSSGFEDRPLGETETWDLCRMSEEVLPHCVDAIQLILHQQELKLSQTRERIHDNLAQQTSQLRVMIENAHKNYSSGHGKLHEEYIKAGLIVPLKPQSIVRTNTSNKFAPPLNGTIRSGKKTKKTCFQFPNKQ